MTNLRRVWIRGFLLAAVLLSCTAATAAPAFAGITLQKPDGTVITQGRLIKWIRESYVKRPVIAITVIVHEQGCPSLPAISCVLRGQDELYLSPSQQDRSVFLHELAHILDHHMSWAERDRFRKITADTRPWLMEAGESRAAPTERWADLYSECATHGQTFIVPGMPVEISGYGNFFLSGPVYRRECQRLSLLQLVPEQTVWSLDRRK